MAKHHHGYPVTGEPPTEYETEPWPAPPAAPPTPRDPHQKQMEASKASAPGGDCPTKDKAAGCDGEGSR